MSDPHNCLGLGDLGDEQPDQPSVPVPSPSPSVAPAVPVESGSAAVPLRGGRFEFGIAAESALSMLKVRGTDREALRRAIESDAGVARAMNFHVPSPLSLLRRAAKAQRRVRK